MKVLCLISTLLTCSSSIPLGQVGVISNIGFNIPTFENLTDVTNEKIGTFFNSKQLVPKFPDSGRTHAVEETEGFISAIDSKFDKAQQFVANFYHPTPIVDTIQEHEKYGNDGDQFRSIGKGIVRGFQGFSNKVNAAIEAPFSFAKQSGRKITSTLNYFGGKLVGLEK